MKPEHYTLDQTGNPQLCADIITWAKWLQLHASDCRLALDFIETVRVSTVFLGMDYSWGAEEPPILYETMVFGGKMDRECRRYATSAEAVAGHAEMCEAVREAAKEQGAT